MSTLNEDKQRTKLFFKDNETDQKTVILFYQSVILNNKRTPPSCSEVFLYLL